uniref:Uncharacterized protein n=1 Tax=Rhizophagus irregularis (strain DAOM 181602 / DAOM 197198 / MUCL 43194) TaxID=747089 RepID=U9TNH4_RHIID
MSLQKAYMKSICLQNLHTWIFTNRECLIKDCNMIKYDCTTQIPCVAGYPDMIS